jgi:hypothetical protein
MMEKSSLAETLLNKKVKKKNGKPEEPVVKAHLDWMNYNGFFIQRVESKAKFIRGVYRHSGVDYGTPDLIGCSAHGLFTAVECKAPGKRNKSSLRPKQREYLRQVIMRGGFGCVSDDLDYFKAVWSEWVTLGRADRARYLINELP